MTRQRIKLCMVVNNLDVGGLERLVISLLQHLSRDVFDLSLVCLSGEGKLFAEVDLPRSRTLVLDKNPDLGGWGAKASVPSLMLRVRDFFQEREVQVVNAHNLAPLLFGGIPARSLGKRPVVIYTEHNQIISYLLEAARIALAEEPRLQFLIAGDGPLRPLLERAAAAANLGPAVRFLGYRTDVPELLSAFDLYVLPSLWEGLPLALLEAMALGKPIVATTVGGNPEVVEHGVNGYLVPPRDPARLAERLLLVARDRRFRDQVRVNNLAKFDPQFSLGAMVTAYARLYEQSLARNLRECILVERGAFA